MWAVLLLCAVVAALNVSLVMLFWSAGNWHFMAIAAMGAGISVVQFCRELDQ